MDLKFGYFADICDHRLTTVSAHTYVYCYSLFESEWNDHFMQKT